MTKEQKEKLFHMINAAIFIEGALAEHFDKYDKEGQKLYKARDQIQKELFDYLKEL